ncbi:MAG: hypothetical protein IJZ63_03630 [Clostridia bacterium]|nr:hypothetical protein [Clostridia bacterium]
MTNNDTVNLLRECNAGIQMGVSAIDEVLPNVESKKLETLLNDYKNKHTQLGNETNGLLQELGEESKEPNPMAKGMSWLKTNVKLSWDESDATVSDLITDGCNMGVKSLSKYLNQYAAADEVSKDICKRLIKLEEKLAIQLRDYL